MENLKIELNNDLDEIIELLKQLGCKYFNYTGSEKNYLLLEDGKVFFCKLKVNFRKSKCREVTIDQLRDMVILHRNDVSDANYSITIASDRPDTPVYKTSDAIYYTYSDHNNKWVFCNSIKSTTTGLKKINKQPDAAASSNEIAKKEYLLPKGQGYELCLCEEGMTIHESWIEIPEGAETAVLFEPKMTSTSRYGELFFWKDNGDTHYMYSERSGCQRPTGWYSCKGNQITTLDEFLQAWAGQCRIVWKRNQPTTPLNDIARTAEDHREHNLSNELNDLCAEFGCLPGMDRLAWLKDQLDISQGRVSLGPLATKARMQQESMELRLALLKDLFQPQPVTYHYAASINTARGTVAYDGVITMPERITDIEDYQKARAQIAKDGNVAPEQVNIHSLSIIS